MYMVIGFILLYGYGYRYTTIKLVMGLFIILIMYIDL